jgi:hypothetical protein
MVAFQDCSVNFGIDASLLLLLLYILNSLLYPNQDSMVQVVLLYKILCDRLCRYSYTFILW